jgi:hypothetical protein
MIPDPNKTFQTVESLVLSKNSGPSRIEVREYEGGSKIVLVYVRKNSRAFDYPTSRFIQLMREVGVQSMIEIHGVEVTPEHFEMAGAYAVKSSLTVQTPTGRYNTTSNLRRLMDEVSVMTPDQPGYDLKVHQISHLQAMLKQVEPKIDAATARSDEGLRHMEGTFAQAAFDESLKIPDEELKTYDFTKMQEVAAQLGIPKQTKQWEAYVSRWVQSRKQGDNDAERPVVADSNKD